MAVRVSFGPIFLSLALVASCGAACMAQSVPADTGANPASANAGGKTAQPNKKPKKVWTDDNIGSAGGEISVVGSSGNKESAKEQSEEGRNSDKIKQALIQKYRNQLKQLQAQVDDCDKKIDQLRNFKADNTGASGGVNPSRWYQMTPVEDQIKALDEKKKRIQARMNDVDDAARKDGIDPGDLR